MNTLSEVLNKRLIFIGCIALIMLIPLTFVSNMVNERHGYYRSVIQDISKLWGQKQILKGPVLIIPFVEEHTVEEKIRNDSGEEKTRIKKIHKTKNVAVLPDNLNMDVQIKEDYRHRGIYESLVYRAKINIKGELNLPDFKKLSKNLHHVDWDRAYLSFGIADTKAINQSALFVWDEAAKTVAPGTRLPKLLGNGIHVPLEIKNHEVSGHSFNLNLDINGSEGLRFSPFGEMTRVRMTSTWPHPSFNGNTLPDSHNIHKEGFEASWEIPHIARNYPQMWILESNQYNLDELLAGVDLFEPVFMYSKITRSVKYGLLFIALTFLTFLIFELSTRAALHLVQYGLIGIALALFYLTLLSLSEHIGFFWAYLSASIINIGLISSYTAAALKKRGAAITIFSLLGALYSILYTLLQLEDYALLMGTSLLFVIIAVLMYLTRHLTPSVAEK